jgi:hypothetical protein
MIKTLISNSALGLTSDNIYYRIKAGKNGLLAMVEDTTANTLTLHFRQKDNTKDGSETMVLQCESGKTALAAADVASVINGLPKNAQVGNLSKGGSSIEGVSGVAIPAFTIANTDIAITGTATDDFTFTLSSATAGCTFSAVLTMDDDSHTFTKTGTIATATDTIVFDSTSFSAGAATLVVTLTNPNQPGVTRVVSKAATITS